MAYANRDARLSQKHHGRADGLYRKSQEKLRLCLLCFRFRRCKRMGRKVCSSRHKGSLKRLYPQAHSGCSYAYTRDKCRTLRYPSVAAKEQGLERIYSGKAKLQPAELYDSAICLAQGV